MYHITAKVARGKEGGRGLQLCLFKSFQNFPNRLQLQAGFCCDLVFCILRSILSQKIGPDIAPCRALSDPRLIKAYLR